MKSKKDHNSQEIDRVTYENVLYFSFLENLPKKELKYFKRSFMIAVDYLIKINRFYENEKNCIRDPHLRKMNSGTIYIFPILFRILKTGVKLSAKEIRTICDEIIERLARSIRKELKQYKDVQTGIEVEMVMCYSNEIINKNKIINKYKNKI